MRVQYPKLRNMAHTHLPFNVFSASEGSYIYILFAAGVVPCGGP